MNTIDAIKRCDTWLAASKSSVNGDLIIVGGAALNWSNYTDRTTTDVDVISIEGGPDTISLIRALRSFADTTEGQELQLDREWINMAATGFTHLMLDNWHHDIQLLYRGSNIRLYSPSRVNLVILKLVAAADRGRQDFDDLQAMRPNVQVLEIAQRHLSHLAKTNRNLNDQKIQAVIAQLGHYPDAS